jgi:predicted MPP superfamily phosphohydrolase
MVLDPSLVLPRGAVRPISRRGFFRRGLALAGSSGLVLASPGAYAAAEAAIELTVTRYTAAAPGWPRGQKLTITVVADLHAGGPNMGLARVRQVVDTANALQGDLVVLLGDYVATHRFVTERVPPPAWAGELARLEAPLGTYAILGNHDWWHDIDGVRRALAGVRIPVMENDAVLLGPPGRRFWLAGLGDQLAHVLGPDTFRGVDDLPGTMRKITGPEPVVLLVHEPDIFPQVPARVSLTLAGHTHGAQIRIPYVEPTWTPSRYGARYCYGHIVEGGRHMIVSGGLGCSKVPLRFGVPPEIVQIELGV